MSVRHLPRLFTPVVVLGLLVGASLIPVQAQQIHRTVGPDGKITFSDRASTNTNTNTNSPATAAVAATASSTDAILPYGLRQTAKRFPVVLYTGPDCTPCTNARALLAQRGVPFTERTVGSNEDNDALQRLSGSSSLPFGTIGSQPLQGFSDSEWTQYLNAAGYPPQSQLPAHYRRPPAAPLAPVKQPEPAVERQSNRSAAEPLRNDFSPPAVPPGPSASNPAGIQF